MKELNELTTAVIREFLALTGVSVGSLFDWLTAQNHFLPVAKHRSSFYKQWLPYAVAAANRESTRQCCLGTRPYACRLRIRAVRFILPRPVDDRAYLLLMAYEPCTSWIGFTLFDDDMAHHGNPASLRVSELVTFCNSAGNSIGLPIRGVRLTNLFLVEDGKTTWMESWDIGKNLRLSLFADKSFRSPDFTVDETPSVCYPAEIFSGMKVSAAKVVRLLDNFVNQHNKAFAIPRIKQGRETLLRLAPEPKHSELLDGFTVGRRRLGMKTVKNANSVDKFTVQSKVTKRTSEC